MTRRELFTTVCGVVAAGFMPRLASTEWVGLDIATGADSTTWTVVIDEYHVHSSMAVWDLLSYAHER